MSAKSTCWGRCYRVPLLLLLLSTPVVGQTVARSSKRGGEPELANLVRPTLMNAQTDPTLRFPATSSSSYGWLDITSTTIRYTVVGPANKAEHSFSVSRFSVRDLRFNRTEVAFRIPKREETFAYLAQDQWQAKQKTATSETQERLGTLSIYNTLMNFDGVLAMLMPPAPPPAPVVVRPEPPAPSPRPAEPPAPPAIVLSSPPGAGENQVLEWGETTVVVRGVAMDSTGIPVVRINGSPANMRPQTPQAAEFWSDPLTLQLGRNPIQIVATNSGHVDSRLALTVDYKPKPAPEKPKPAAVNPRSLDRLEIIGLLQGGVPPARVFDLVKQRGIKFSPTSDDLNAIRAAGATDDLIEAIQQAAPHP